MVTQDGTQCGFCTPGFVMALHALRHSGEAVTDEVIHDALAGNLCRCIGYRSIVDAARTACSVPVNGGSGGRDDRTSLPASDFYEAQSQLYYAPKTIDALIARRSEHPDAPLLAGGPTLACCSARNAKSFRSRSTPRT